MNIKNTNIDNRTIIFYDGVCNLCNGLVQFILRKDSRRKFRLVALQSQAGKDHLKQFSISGDTLRTLIVLVEDRIYIRSRAIFKIFNELGGFWNLFLIFSILPVRFNDLIYNLIAKHRYRIFGKRKECLMLE